MNHEKLGTNNNREKEEIPGYQKFRREILESVDSISGEKIKRTAGTFSLKNILNESIEINFATSVHEDEPNSLLASEPELNFLRNYLLKENTGIDLLLVEQGSPLTTQNHINRIIKEIARNNPDLADAIKNKQIEKLEREKRRPRSSEIKILPEEFSSESKSSLNIDLEENPLAYSYILEDKGLKEMVHFACRQLSGEISDWKQFLPKLVVEVLKATTNIDQDTALQAENMAITYIDTVADEQELWDEQILETNEYRDFFMAQQLIQLPQGRYKLLCHTAHLTGIIEKLKTKLQDISLLRSEIAEFKLNRLKASLKRRQKTSTM